MLMHYQIDIVFSMFLIFFNNFKRFQSIKNFIDSEYLPDIGCLRRGKLLSEVTLLLSIDKSTDGNGAVVPSECDRS